MACPPSPTPWPTSSRGNHDHQVAFDSVLGHGLSDAHAYRQLSEADRAWLGHTHIPRCALERALIVNPGSVGLQAYQDEGDDSVTVENGSPHARYAVLENTGGEWKAGSMGKLPCGWVS